MAIASYSMTASAEPSGAGKAWRELFGPQLVDQHIRMAISTCWIILPPGKKTAEAVEKEIRRVVDRALANLREDAAAFGIDTAAKPRREAAKGRRT